MAEIDAGTDGLLHGVFPALVFVPVLQFLFGREDLRQVAPVRECVHDVPLHVRLLHIAHRIALQDVFLVPEHALFKVGERLVGFGFRVPHHGSVAIEVLRASAHPQAFGQGEHGGIEMVLQNHVVLLREQTVVPQGDDGSHHIVVLLGAVVHPAVVQGHEVGEGVEVVGIVETAVHMRNARSDLSVEAPHLHEVYFARLVLPSRIPGDHLLALGADVGHHFGNECRVGESHLVGTDVEVRHIEGLAHLVHEELEDLHAFGALHVVAEGSLEGSAMSRHVDFRNERHLTRLAVFHEFLGFFEGIVLARHACHVPGIVQHREDPALEAPCLVLGEVPVEDIDLVSGKHVDFTLELVEGDVASSVVLHESAYLERGPVHDAARLDVGSPIALSCQLTEGLHGPVDALFGGGFHGDGLAGHHESVGFLLVEFGTFNGRHDLHLDQA